MSKNKKREFVDVDKNVNIQLFRESVVYFFRNVPDPRAADNCEYSQCCQLKHQHTRGIGKNRFGCPKPSREKCLPGFTGTLALRASF